MDEQTAGRHRTIVARLTIALGTFGMFRIIPELLGVIFWLKLPINRIYAAILVLDVTLGVGALAGGWVLRRSSKRGWVGIAAAWGAVAANSAVMALLLFRLEYRDFRLGKEGLLLLPRTAFYLASLLAVPYVLWASFTASRSGFMFRVLVASMVGLLAMVFWWTTAVIMEVDPIHLQSSWAR